MIVLGQLPGLDKPIFCMLPVELDLLRAVFQLPREGMNRPFSLQPLVREAERFSLPEKSDILIRKRGLFQDLSLGRCFWTLVVGFNGPGADGPLTSASCD